MELHTLPENKWPNKFTQLVKKVTQPLVLAALLSTNTAFANPNVEQLWPQKEVPEYVVNEKSPNTINQSPIKPVWIDQAEYEQRVQELVSLINQYRRENWLNEVTLSHKLDAASQWYANYSVKDWWYKGHTSRDWKTFQDRLRESSNYDWFAVENIMYSAWDSQRVLNWWIQSPWHNRNLLVDQWKYVSIWIAKNEYWTYITVMIIHD